MLDKSSSNVIIQDMIIENIAKSINKSGKSRYHISKETGIDQAVLCRIVNGGSCSIETANILLKYFRIKLVKKKSEEKAKTK
jgi:ribosome-binding protein aMBF1 (putative translation factor)